MGWGWITDPAGFLCWGKVPSTPADRATEKARLTASRQRQEKVREDARRRRGLIFALRSSGATTAEIARVIGTSWPRVRQIEHGIDAAIQREADRRFPLPRWHDWAAYAADLAARWPRA